MTLADSLNLVLGALEIVLALVVLRHLGRFGRSFPWLAALMVFFVLRGIDRIYAGLSGGEALGPVVDSVLVGVVFLLALGIDRTVAGLSAAQNEAAYRTAEYARALADYESLARHRLANPLAAIRGGVATLKDVPDLDAETRRQLLESIEEQALRLEQVALEPEIHTEEEVELRPRPRV